MRLVCVCPNPAIDHTVVVAGLVANETTRASEAATTAGGKGINVARFAAGFGATVTGVTWLGDVGAGFVHALAARDGLELRATVVPSSIVRVCPVLVDVHDQSVITTSDPPPSLDAEAWSSFVELAASAAQGADAICVAGSFPLVEDPDGLGSLLRAIGEEAPVWVDTSGAALAALAGSFPAMGLKINLAEARDLLTDGAEGVDENTAASGGHACRARALAAAEALSNGVRSVVVTAGAAGAAEVTATGSRWQDAPAVEVRNPTASGDAFLAGYLCAGHGRLRSLEDPLLAGVLAGAANARTWAPSAPAEAVLALAAALAGETGR